MKKLFFLLAFLFTTVIFIQAADPVIWTVGNRAEVLKGDAKGVTIDENGAISVAPKLTEAFDTQQTYIWSSAIDTGGNVYLGTGNDGKIFKVDPSGKSSLFADLAELDITALAIGKDGVLYAGSSPDGKVYRIDAGGNQRFISTG